MNILNNLLTQLELATELASSKAKNTGQLYDKEMANCLSDATEMIKTGTCNINAIGETTKKLSQAYWKDKNIEEV